MTTAAKSPATVDDVQRLLREQQYIADRALSVAVFLAITLQRPLFLEGEAGVGKTEIARALSRGLDTELIRLQCYEGLDINHAGLRVEPRPPDAGDKADGGWGSGGSFAGFRGPV